MSWKSNAKKATLRFEGSITHMYLDTAGYVTVGVGQLLKAKSDAAKLGFVKREGGKKASKAEIEQDWANVKKQTKGKKASAYKQHTKLDLPNTVITSLLDKRLGEFESGIKGIYPKFNKLPDPVKEGLMDIAYNTGIGGLKKFKKLKVAIDDGDYEAAAKETKRGQVSASRNKYVYDLFMKAASEAPMSTKD